MSDHKPWVRPQGFADVPKFQRVMSNIHLDEHPELARLMWFAPPGTRSQLTIRLMVAGLAALNGQLAFGAPDLPPPPSRPRRIRGQGVPSPQASPKVHNSPISAAIPTLPGPAPSPLTSAPPSRTESPPPPGQIPDAPDSVDDQTPRGLPQFELPTAPIESDTDPEDTPPVSGGLALLSSFRSL
jgi:hypothetical protein